MDNDVKYVQLQIKAFNKALSRADKANILGGDTYATINDLIDYERMTRSGYAKAGAKYLEKMTPNELAAYSADIKQAKDLIELEKTISLIGTENFNKIKENPFDSIRKLMSIRIDEGGNRITLVKGAPERILDRCKHRRNTLMMLSRRRMILRSG